MSAPKEPGRPSDPWARPDERYATRPRWDIGRPQPALLALAEAGEVRGEVLDAGCGTGEHALMAARLGLDATGIDLAGSALEQAAEKARQRGLRARFLRHDARRLAELGSQFDVVLDCGLFHLLSRSDEDRAAYVDGLCSVVRPGGRYFMLGFRAGAPDDREPDHPGPRRLTREDIEAALTPGWRIDSIEPTTIDSLTDPEGEPAWLVAATRVEAAERGGADGPAAFSAEARVATERASLRLAQFCRHASKMRGDGVRHGPGVRNVEWSDTRGVVDAGWGRCTLTAEAGGLVLLVEAADEDGLRRLQQLVAHRMETIGSREGLQVRWEPQAPGPDPASGGLRRRLSRAVQRWKYRLAIGAGSGGGVVGWLVSVHTVGVHAAGAHLLLLAAAGAAVVALSRWLEWGPAVAVVLAAALLVVLVRVSGLHRRLLRGGRHIPGRHTAGREP